MHKITLEAIDDLAAYEGEEVLTIYLPTNPTPTPPNISENQTRYKNMIRKGFEQWAQALPGKKRELTKLERRMEERIDDLGFWKHTSRSLAIFVSLDATSLYHLPVEVNEQVYVGSVYDTVPLLEFKSRNQPYYVFALAMHEPKLFRGDMYGLEAVAIDFPASPEAALNIDEMFIGSNTIRAGSGSMNGSPHGQGDSQQAGREERLMYFRILDLLMQQASAVNKECPIVVAATDSEAGDYLSLTKLPNILKAHITGNRTREDRNVLHELAARIVEEEVIIRQLTECAEEYERLVGAQKATENLAEIQDAAKEGRVAKLLLSVFDRRRDSVSDTMDGVIYVEEVTEEQHQGLLRMIRDVIMNGGNVEFFSKRLMPAAAHVAAVYRY